MKSGTRVTELSLLFFLSGFSALTIELVFVKYLGYVFGTTAHAISTVLAAFMLGLSLGNVIGGRYSERITRRLRWYGGLELAVGLFAVVSPLLFRALGELVGSLGSHFADGEHGIAWLTLLRFCLAALIVLPPTVAMGLSFPLLVRSIRELPDLEGNIGRLYTINTLGAAVGTMSCTYVIIGALGLMGTLLLVLGLNTIVFVGCWFLDRNDDSLRSANAPAGSALFEATNERPLNGDAITSPSADGSRVLNRDAVASRSAVDSRARNSDAVASRSADDARVLNQNADDARARNPDAVASRSADDARVLNQNADDARVLTQNADDARVLTQNADHTRARNSDAAVDGLAARWLSPAVIYTLAGISGFVTLAFEVLWSHLLATVVGTSTYAFGLVLAIFLVALAASGAIVSRVVGRLSTRNVVALLGVGLLVTGLTISHSMANWERAGAIFELVGYFKPSFFGRELTRALVVLWLIFVPALTLGILFPAALCLQRGGREGSSRRVGITYAVNTAGTIVGSTLTGFWLIERFGSQGTMRLLAGVVTVLALPLLLVIERRALRFGAIAAGVWCGASLVWSSPWDIARMTSGSNIYFAKGFDRSRHRLVHFVEDVHGGMTTVVSDGTENTLMTNGKFEGNNGPERLDQILFAAIPNLFVKTRGRALNIGIGTGQTASVLHAFGYRELDAVDISPNIVETARLWFKDVHRGVFDEKNVHVRIRDGRNHLLLTKDRYDLISIELTSIWFASAGNLYSREFYELCRRRLNDDGILQQWVQLHHIELEDVATIIATMKSVFPEVELWLGGHQGILVAGEHLPTPDPNVLHVASSRGRELLALSGLEDPHAILTHRLVPKDKMDAVLGRIARQPERLSTDDSVVLEYSTPRGNALEGAEEDHLAAIRRAL